MHLPERPALARDLAFAVTAIIAVAAAALVGQLATYPNLAPWYAGLAKPSFTPPNWIFGPVWTTLYLLMAFSAWRILRLPPTRERRSALTPFFLQLVLNAAWPLMFFAAKSPLLGLLNISIQLVVIFAKIMEFFASIGSRAGVLSRWPAGLPMQRF